MRALIFGLLTSCAFSTYAHAEWYCPEEYLGYRVLEAKNIIVVERSNELTAYRRVAEDAGLETYSTSDGDQEFQIARTPKGFDWLDGDKRISHTKCAIQ